MAFKVWQAVKQWLESSGLELISDILRGDGFPFFGAKFCLQDISPLREFPLLLLIPML